MKNTNTTKEETLYLFNKFKDKYLKQLNLYSHMVAVISYDTETVAPMKSYEANNEDINFISNIVADLTHSKDFVDTVLTLYKNIDLLECEEDKVLIRKHYKSILDEKNLTKEDIEKIVSTNSKGYLAWMQAREKNDFNVFKPVLQEILDISNFVFDKSGLLDKTNAFDYYLNKGEDGLNSNTLDKIFNDIKGRIVSLINKIRDSNVNYDYDFTHRFVPTHKQVEFSKYLLETIGYDFSRGALGFTQHPFTTSIAKDDHRITTHIFENDFISNMYSILHEGGHALFGQNIPSECYDHYIEGYRTLGMDESVSRFFENVIGRSKSFIHLIYPKFKEIFKEEFSDVTEDMLYHAVNYVKLNNLIRTEADELTYTLHIIIRYEMEKAFFDKTLSLDDARNKWNSLYKEYLNVNVTNDNEGILQDVHWSSGFGYFPTYAIGNIYNAMYFNKMKRDLDVDKLILSNNIKEIVKYMKNNIFSKASVMKPEQWIKSITGRDLDTSDFIKYLEEKYYEIYKLQA